jgi:hypothetical protein
MCTHGSTWLNQSCIPGRAGPSPAPVIRSLAGTGSQLISLGEGKGYAEAKIRGDWGSGASFTALKHISEKQVHAAAFSCRPFVFIYLVVILRKPEIQIILTLPEGSEVPLARVSLGVTRLSAEVVINLQAAPRPSRGAEPNCLHHFFSNLRTH